MKFIVELIAVLIVGVMNHALGTFFYIKNPDFPKLFTASDQLLRRWLGTMSGIAVVLLVAINQPHELRSVGIQHTDNSSAILAGWLAITALLMVFALIFRLSPRIRKVTSSPSLDTSQTWIAESMQYRDRWERFAYLTILPLDVISEELVYRGYFVLFLGNKTGTFIPWAIISVSMSVIIHLYQGRNIKTVIFHIIAASFFVSLAIATQNILAPISAHLYYNFIMTMQTWQRTKEQDVALLIFEQNRVKKLAYGTFIGINILILWLSAVWVLG